MYNIQCFFPSHFIQTLRLLEVGLTTTITYMVLFNNIIFVAGTIKNNIGFIDVLKCNSNCNY